MRIIFQFIISFLAAILLFSSCKENSTTYDVCVYGGTASGVIAAYSASKMGKKVILIEPGQYLGGMTTGGLGEIGRASCRERV